MSQRPIPQWLVVWGCASLLVISFLALVALWPRPRLENDRRWRPVPGGRVIAGPLLQGLCGVIGLALFAVTIVSGYSAPGVALGNWASTFILITCWVGLAFGSIVFGDVFRAFNPWRTLGRLLPSQNRPYPERLGRWPATAGLLGFMWVALVSGWGGHPARLVSAALFYALAMLVAQAHWGVDTWGRRGDAFAVYFNLFSRLSLWETRAGRLGVRPPLTALPKLDRAPGTVGFVVVMIGSVTFARLGQGPWWRSLSTGFGRLTAHLGCGRHAAGLIIATLGLGIAVALIRLVYRLGIDGVRSVGGRFSSRRLEDAFIHTLVPIAVALVAAHSLTALLFEGQAIDRLASDPFGRGWDLFGTAASGIDHGMFSGHAIWCLQVAILVAGQLAAVTLAHDRALALYHSARLALRAQYWMLATTVGLTSLALWLLAHAASRGSLAG